MWRWRTLWLSSLIVVAAIGCAAAGAPDRPVQQDQPGPPSMGISEGVQGHVTTPDGRPIAGAFVQAASLETPSPPIPDLAILTQADGRYQWALLPGTYALTVSAEGYRPATQPVTIPPGRVVTQDVTLTPVP